MDDNVKFIFELTVDDLIEIVQDLPKKERKEFLVKLGKAVREGMYDDLKHTHWRHRKEHANAVRKT